MDCEHDFALIVPDPSRRANVGLEHCDRCGLEITRIHPLRPTFLEPPSYDGWYSQEDQ